MYFVYILSNWNTKVTYIGFTSNLKKRIYEHKNHLVKGFTSKYRVDRLVYYESGEGFDGVLAREKEIKKWRREKKVELIEKFNPKWRDLYEEID